jgi:hypothetical protein
MDFHPLSAKEKFLAGHLRQMPRLKFHPLLAKEKFLAGQLRQVLRLEVSRLDFHPLSILSAG